MTLSQMGTHPLTVGSVQEAVEVIQRGGLVAFPTETVYGLGADATNPKAVAKIFDVKGRPRFDPLIVHVASVAQARSLWTTCPDIAEKLMKRFWPGPLTLVLPKNPVVLDLVTAGLPTVAVRMPDHPAVRHLIELAGCPVAAPSANRFGRPSPTTAQAVEEDLGSEVDLILDDGPTPIGVESTVLAFEDESPILLRPGGISLEALTEILGEVRRGQEDSARPSSPGMLKRHYAPRTPLYLLDESSLRHLLEVGETVKGKVGLLSFMPVARPSGFSRVEILSPTGDLVEAASRFFQMLRLLDGLGLDAIVATPIPQQGLGLALMDRLQRASSGRAVVVEGAVRFIGGSL